MSAEEIFCSIETLNLLEEILFGRKNRKGKPNSELPSPLNLIFEVKPCQLLKFKVSFCLNWRKQQLDYITPKSTSLRARGQKAAEFSCK